MTREEIQRMAAAEVDDLAQLLGETKFNRLRYEAAQVLERATDRGSTIGLVEAFLLAETTLRCRARPLRRDMGNAQEKSVSESARR